MSKLGEFTSSEFSISPAMLMLGGPCLIQELSLLYQMNSDALDSLKADGVVGASRLPSEQTCRFVESDDRAIRSMSSMSKNTSGCILMMWNSILAGYIYIYIIIYIIRYNIYKSSSMICVYIHCMSWNMIGISSGLFFSFIRSKARRPPRRH